MSSTSLQAQNSCLVLISACLALTVTFGCGRNPSTGSLPASGLQTATLPGELRDAKLLYQRPDGIYLSRPAAGEHRMIALDGACPRWFPNGAQFAFIRGRRIMLFNFNDSSERELTRTDQPSAALAVHANGQEVFFIDGESICKANIETGQRSTVLSNQRFRELDVQGNTLAATVKFPLQGFGVMRFSLTDGTSKRMGTGCSSSISPDGTQATLNLHGHRQLAILDLQTGTILKTLSAPAPYQLDNQYWSNHPAWITAVTQDGNILLQRVSDAAAWKVTDTGDTDRADLFVP